MNDISERDGKWYIVDETGKPISTAYATQREAELGGIRTTSMLAPMMVAPAVAEKPAPPRTGVPVLETQPKPGKIRTTYLSEAAVFVRGPDGVPADGTIPVTLITPGWSKNGRYYSKEALARAVPKFDGARAYLDHPTKADETNRPERSVKDIAGYYSDVKQADDGRLVGNLHLVGVNGTFVKPLIDEALAGKDGLIGLSINALGKTSQGEAEGRKGIIVEDIAQANSTDIVTTPAAGGRFERLAASDDGFTSNLLAAMDYDEWAQVRPDFIKRLREEVKTQRQDEAIKDAQVQSTALREANAALTARNTELETQLTEASKAVADMRAEQARRAAGLYADQLLKESHLPTAWQTTLQPQLLAEANTGIWAGLIERERVKFASVRTSIPVQVNGAITRAGAHSVVNESVVPLPGESAEAYGRRMGYLR